LAEIIFPNLGITFESLDPVAFRVAGFSIYWYAIFVVLGIIAGYYFGAHFMPKRTGQSPKNYTDFGVWVIPSAILGGRLFYLAFTPWPPDAGFFYIFNLRDGGIAIWGVLITSIVVCAIYARARKIPFFHFTDTGIVGFIIGHVIGRFGNFTNREAFGGYAPNNAPFAMQLRLGTIRGPVTQETIDNIVTRGGAQYYQVHPTFLYEAAINLALFIFLVIYSKKKKFNGEIVAIYFLGIRHNALFPRNHAHRQPNDWRYQHSNSPRAFCRCCFVWFGLFGLRSHQLQQKNFCQTHKESINFPKPVDNIL
jgi:phosphatidylglycerol:prolipoprotein diacylglycerol transferase